VSFRRFKVLDLFFPVPENAILRIKEWIDSKKRLPESTAMYALKLDDNETLLAYFCSDKCMPIMKNFESSYWWSRHGHEMIPQDWVTHWSELVKED